MNDCQTFITGQKSIGLYIHIPFCRAKCYYCDFNSFAGRNELIPAYFDALKEEIRLYSKKLEGYSFKTVFIGGGTPSVVEAEYIYDTLNTCMHHLDIEKKAEISIETNPGTLSYDKLMTYKAIGINRLSIGLQAWQGSLLRKLGRIHSADEFVENAALAKKAGFKNINADLMFGIPGQSLKEWNETLVNVAKLGLTHISCYSLKIEEGTVFGKQLDAQELIPIDDESDREMYDLTIERLKNFGYGHYEISNFSLPGYECRHNLIYWNAQEYLGLGAGAHSYLSGQRYNNYCDIEHYTSTLKNGGIPRENIVQITKEESMSEYMILGLRLVDGIDRGHFKQRYANEIYDIYGTQLDKLQQDGLIDISEKRIKLSSKGLDLANHVFMEFI